ncbi:MAG TPA: hypothetical protein VM712_06725 [Gaiellales bacterium]|jgi:hypothetical protein|nr:hypothetical protein [Gaiellales bacterium]
MNTATNRQRLAHFIDIALTPRKLYGRRISAVPIPASVLATCGEEMHALADALRDERRAVDAGTLRELQHVLTHGATSPLYDGSHPLRALHTLVAIESRFGDASTCAA